MNWEERIRQSDAGRLNPDRAEEIVREAKEQIAPKPIVDARVPRRNSS